MENADPRQNLLLGRDGVRTPRGLQRRVDPLHQLVKLPPARLLKPLEEEVIILRCLTRLADDAAASLGFHAHTRPPREEPRDVLGVLEGLAYVPRHCTGDIKQYASSITQTCGISLSLIHI